MYSSYSVDIVHEYVPMRVLYMESEERARPASVETAAWRAGKRAVEMVGFWGAMRAEHDVALLLQRGLGHVYRYGAE
jgi:hypothetical protein